MKFRRFIRQINQNTGNLKLKQLFATLIFAHPALAAAPILALARHLSRIISWPVFAGRLSSDGFYSSF